MKVLLEDEFEDIINKAHVGLLADGDSSLPERAESILSLCDRISSGEVPEREIAEIADSLKLKAESLIKIARKPEIDEITLPDCFHKIVMPFGPYTVNTYVLIHSQSKQCVIFDAGTRADDILSFLDSSGLSPRTLFITHGHRDHISGIGSIKRAYPNIQIYSYSRTLYPGSIPARENDVIRFEKYAIKVFQTFGHSQDSVSYLIQDDAWQAMVVGDAIFAGSIGNIKSDYHGSLETIRNKILEQKPETYLLPGHGPVTTVGHEIEHNPFFPS